MKNVIGLLILVMFLVSCNSGKKDTTSYSKTDDEASAENHPGKKLMETNCYLCHSSTAGENDRIGPPMIAIKRHYINDNTTKEDFVAAMQAWIKNPNEADAKMPGAVKKFGVMPKQYYPEETIAKISEYMFDFEIDQPEWFEDHYSEEKGIQNRKRKRTGNEQGGNQGNSPAKTNYEDLPYGERGLKYALTTKAVLGKNLMGTIQSKGVLEALAFCNEQAYPLTDSMAVAHNTNIKRVTDKPRNPNNKANTAELTYIDNFKEAVANKKEASPIVKERDNQVKVYYPITTNNMCLQCHGKPNEDIARSTFTKIKSLYPTDKANGYKINEVRGIWSITFDK